MFAYTQQGQICLKDHVDVILHSQPLLPFIQFESGNSYIELTEWSVISKVICMWAVMTIFFYLV